MDLAKSILKLDPLKDITLKQWNKTKDDFFISEWNIDIRKTWI